MLCVFIYSNWIILIGNAGMAGQDGSNFSKVKGVLSSAAAP